MDTYIALTGLPACGKETLKDALFRAAEKRGVKTFHISFTDVLRDECNVRGLECNRQNYTDIANDLREKHGSDILAERIVEKVRTIQKEEDDCEKLFVLEAVRNPRESELFKERLGDRYALAAITAPRETLIERMQSRKRVDEQPGALDSRKTAEALLDREIGIGQPPTGLQVGKCLEQADIRVDNSGSMEQLEEQADQILAEQS